jgi:transposase-like protein
MKARPERERRYKPRAIDKEKEDYWRKIFACFQISGLAFKKFCVQEGISPNTFQYWRRELRKRDEARGITSLISKGDNRPSKFQQNVEYWLTVIDEINAYEGSVRSYCLSHGISSGSLHFWEKRLMEMKLTNGVRKNDQASDPLFVPMQVLDDCAQIQGSNSVSVRLVA